MIPLTFNKTVNKLGLTLLFLSVCASSQMRAASTTFAQFTDNGAQDFSLTNNADGSQTFSISAPVFFTYSNIPGLSANLQGPLSAILTFTGTSSSSVGLASVAGVQQAFIGGFSGAFQFTASTPVNGNSDLLSGTFGSVGLLLGQNGGQSATFSDTTTGNSLGEVHFSSNILAFANQSEENFGISLSSIFDTQLNQGGFNVNGNNVDNFTASGTGTFASNPAPSFDPSPVPEASSYGLFGLGLVLLGGLRWWGVSRAAKLLPISMRNLAS